MSRRRLFLLGFVLAHVAGAIAAHLEFRRTAAAVQDEARRILLEHLGER